MKPVSDILWPAFCGDENQRIIYKEECYAFEV